MSDNLDKGIPDMTDAEFGELSDEMLDSVAGGYIYHDAGDSAQHRKEYFYVVDDKGKIVMRLDNLKSAQHWADNLRTSQRIIDAKELEQLRQTGKL